jgi:site-specific recombinase XerD
VSGLRPGPDPQVLAPLWDLAVEDWREHQRIERNAADTIAKRTKHVRRFATTCNHADPFAVTTEQLTSWLRAQPWQATTATAHRSSLRHFYAWAAATGRTSANPALYLSAVNTSPTSDVARELGASGPLPEPVPPAWDTALRMFAREERASGRSEQTIGLRTAQLCRLARDLHPLEPFTVSFYDLVEWMAAHTWAVETRRSHRSTLRTFYAWALEAGHVTTDPAARLPKTGVGLPNPHPASETSVHFAILTATPRERLMVRLSAELGMRRVEVCRVHSRDLVDDDSGWSLLVHGKGARDRLLPLPYELAAELRDLPPGWAFPSDRGGHLSAPYVGKLVSRLLPEGITMHALRHRFATRAWALEHDVFTVQQLLGHASPETTRRYVAVSNQQLRSTVQTLATTTTRIPQQVSR